MKQKVLIAIIMIVCFIFINPFIAFADDNDIFGNICETLEPNILIILDNSGSMVYNKVTVDGKKYTRLWVAKEAIKTLIENNAEKNRLGLMVFNYNDSASNSGGKIVYSCANKEGFILDNGELKTGEAYTDAITAYKAALTTAVTNVKREGATPLAETLFEAGRYFAGEKSAFNTSGTYMSATGVYTSPQGFRCRKNYIVLLTDGAPTYDRNLQGKSINGKTPGASADFFSLDEKEYYRNGDPRLHDVAKLLFEEDLNNKFPKSAAITNYLVQNAVTYPIGFGSGIGITAAALLQKTADKGQGESTGEGKYYDATDTANLPDIFESIMNEINEKKTAFAAPIVPIGDASRAYSGKYVYLAMFSPKSTGWAGNLKKYSINDALNFSSCDTQDDILDPTGAIKGSAQSCWSVMDGDNVDKGGAGELLKPRTNRMLKYNSGSASALKAFNSTNLKDSDFSFVPGTMPLAELISHVNRPVSDWRLLDINHSQPAFGNYKGTDYIFVGSNGGMLHCFDNSTGAEVWGFIPDEQFDNLDNVNNLTSHSFFMDGSPTVCDTDNDGYSETIIIGERRGGNHYYALNISTPTNPSFLFKYLTTGQSWKKPEYIGFQKSATMTDIVKAFLITGGYDERYDTADVPVLATGDPAIKGANIDIINATNGSLLKRFDSDSKNTFGGYVSGMDHSIVVAKGIDLVENGKDAITQIYAQDLEGQIFALRDNDPTSLPIKNAMDNNWQKNLLFKVTGSTVGKKMFSSLDFVREFMRYYDDTLATPNWVPVVGDWTYFGTGDRTDPLDTQNGSKTNYFYCVKNDWHTQNITTSSVVDDFTTLDEFPNNLIFANQNHDPVMIDLTDNAVQDGKTNKIKQAVKDSLRTKYNRGWYIELEGLGEKCLSSPIVYAGVVYFTTYTPPPPAVPGAIVDPCESSMTGGLAKLYAVDYKTGAAIYRDWDGNPKVLDKNDRYTKLNQKNITIPPNPVIIITSKGSKLFVGLKTFPVKEPNSGVTSFYWIDQANVN